MKKKKIFIGQGNGERELKKAWQELYQSPIPPKKLSVFLSQQKGTFIRISAEGQEPIVYWVAVGKSKSICKQAWADFWPLLEESILQWEIIEADCEDEV